MTLSPDVTPPPAPSTSPREVLKAVGIDGGFAKTGVAGVALVDRQAFVSLGGRVIQTEPEHRKGLRISTDDVRRTIVFYDAFIELFKKIGPHAVGLEDYHVYDTADTAQLVAESKKLVKMVEELDGVAAFTASLQNGTWEYFREQVERVKVQAHLGSDVVGKRGRGKAAKTLLVNGAAISACRALGIPLFNFMPADRNKHFVGRARAGKDEVEAGVRRVVAKVDEKIAERVKAKGLRNHAYDATALAVLALKEYTTYHRGSTSDAVVLPSVATTASGG